jgi:hypothetical protein
MINYTGRGRADIVYLNVCLERANLVDAMQDGECAAFEDVAEHRVIGERAVQGRFADVGHFEL